MNAEPQLLEHPHRHTWQILLRTTRSMYKAPSLFCAVETTGTVGERKTEVCAISLFPVAGTRREARSVRGHIRETGEALKRSEIHGTDASGPELLSCFCEVLPTMFTCIPSQSSCEKWKIRKFTWLSCRGTVTKVQDRRGGEMTSVTSDVCLCGRLNSEAFVKHEVLGETHSMKTDS